MIYATPHVRKLQQPNICFAGRKASFFKGKFFALNQKFCSRLGLLLLFEGFDLFFGCYLEKSTFLLCFVGRRTNIIANATRGFKHDFVLTATFF